MNVARVRIFWKVSVISEGIMGFGYTKPPLENCSVLNFVWRQIIFVVIEKNEHKGDCFFFNRN